jgi:hypothetical protein
MSVNKADEYRHNNPDNAFVDSQFVRGGRRKVADREELYGLVVKADQLDQDVTIVRILSDGENDGQTTEVILVDDTQIGAPAGWKLQAAGQGGAPTGDYVDLTTNQSIAGQKTFTDNLTVTGSAFGTFLSLGGANVQTSTDATVKVITVAGDDEAYIAFTSAKVGGGDIVVSKIALNPDTGELSLPLNTVAVTPSEDFDVATKKYVDDTVAASGASGGSFVETPFTLDVTQDGAQSFPAPAGVQGILSITIQQSTGIVRVPLPSHYRLSDGSLILDESITLVAGDTIDGRYYSGAGSSPDTIEASHVTGQLTEDQLPPLDDTDLQRLFELLQPYFDQRYTKTGG